MPREYVDSRYGSEREVKRNQGDALSWFQKIMGGGGTPGYLNQSQFLFDKADRLGYLGRRSADKWRDVGSKILGIGGDAAQQVAMGSGVAMDPILKAELENILDQGSMAQDWGLESFAAKLGLDEAKLLSLVGLWGDDVAGSNKIDSDNNKIWDEIGSQPSTLVSTLQGASSGGSAGASTGNPVAVAVGAILGGLFGFFGSKDKKKKLMKLLRQDNRLFALADELEMQNELEARATGEKGKLTPESEGEFTDFLSKRLNSTGNAIAGRAEERLMNASQLAQGGSYMADTLDEILRGTRRAGRGALTGLREGVNRALPAHQAKMGDAYAGMIGTKRRADAGASTGDPANVRSDFYDWGSVVGTGLGTYGSYERNKKPKNQNNEEGEK